MRDSKYRDRKDAGEQLAKLLSYYATSNNVIILALPRGGIPVAYPIARKLHLPLYPYVVRKLGVPGYAELAMGAIATGGVVVFNQDIINDMGVTQSDIDAVTLAEKAELARREKAYLPNKTLPTLHDKIIMLVDDGVATGATIKAAIAAIKRSMPSRIIVAVPVCPQDTLNDIRHLVDVVICPLSPDYFNAVGEWYDEFPAVEDHTVQQMIADADTANN